MTTGLRKQGLAIEMQGINMSLGQLREAEHYWVNSTSLLYVLFWHVSFKIICRCTQHLDWVSCFLCVEDCIKLQENIIKILYKCMLRKFFACPWFPFEAKHIEKIIPKSSTQIVKRLLGHLPPLEPFKLCHCNHSDPCGQRIRYMDAVSGLQESEVVSLIHQASGGFI